MSTHKTAIQRPWLSKPAQLLLPWLLAHPNKRVLDFGCGRGGDVVHLRKYLKNIDGYDPYFSPIRIKGLYDIILCTYVLDVIKSKEEREKVLAKIDKHLKVGGEAFYTVRRDVPIGSKTQFQVNLPYETLYKSYFHRIYRYVKDVQ